LLKSVMKCPVTPEDWKAVTEGFTAKWNFPHCVGAIDGKHIAIRCSRNKRSLYFDYKGFHSIVLLALVDADYKFLYVNIGASGAGSDRGVFGETDLKEAFEGGSIICMPEPDHYLMMTSPCPTSSWVMTPFP